MVVWRYKKSILIVSLLAVFTLLFFLLSPLLGKVQDCFYGSRYFRPYAELKYELNRNQVVVLRNNKILLLGYEHSELFDPYTKTSRIMGGWKGLNIFSEYINAIELKNGNVLFWQGNPDHPNGITCRKENVFDGPQPCPLNEIPQFDFKTQKINFKPFIYPLQFLQGHTVNLLENNKVLIAGGRLYSLGLPSNYTLKLSNDQAYENNNVILYDPVLNTYKVLGHLIKPRYNHHLFFDGRDSFIVIGGKEYQEGMADGAHPSSNAFVTQVERFDLKTGKSKIIKNIEHGGAREVINLGDGKYLLCWNYLAHGIAASELIDLNRPTKNSFIYGKPPKNHMEAGGNCIALPNKRILCTGEKEVREIDPINLKSRSLDYLMTPQLSDVKVVNLPNLGILVFGNSRNLFGTVKTVQRFDYDRYLRDLKHEGK